MSIKCLWDGCLHKELFSTEKDCYDHLAMQHSSEGKQVCQWKPHFTRPNCLIVCRHRGYFLDHIVSHFSYDLRPIPCQADNCDKLFRNRQDRRRHEINCQYVLDLNKNTSQSNIGMVRASSEGTSINRPKKKRTTTSRHARRGSCSELNFANSGSSTSTYSSSSSNMYSSGSTNTNSSRSTNTNSSRSLNTNSSRSINTNPSRSTNTKSATSSSITLNVYKSVFSKSHPRIFSDEAVQPSTTSSTHSTNQQIQQIQQNQQNQQNQQSQQNQQNQLQDFYTPKN
ncbi:hypothetical protein HDU92_004051 [Lobulomyces angularis]|nr:hypothetical protein HDU92_004051 [Lobulomyces angularis]